MNKINKPIGITLLAALVLANLFTFYSIFLQTYSGLQNPSCEEKKQLLSRAIINDYLFSEEPYGYEQLYHVEPSATRVSAPTTDYSLLMLDLICNCNLSQHPAPQAVLSNEYSTFKY